MKTDLNENWPVTAKRFIAFIDIMGFKEMVARNSHADVLIKINSLVDEIKNIEESYKELLAKSDEEKNKSPFKSIIRSSVFSDSILLVSKGDTVNDAAEIILAAQWVLNRSFEKGIPVKGAISYGEFTADFIKSLYLGQPLIDAYLLQEELWLYGVALDGYFEDLILSNTIYHENKEFLLKYETPTKIGKINYHLVNWCGRMGKEAEGIFKSFYKSAIGHSRLYVDNTETFYNYSINKLFPLITKKELDDNHSKSL